MELMLWVLAGMVLIGVYLLASLAAAVVAIHRAAGNASVQIREQMAAVTSASRRDEPTDGELVPGRSIPAPDELGAALLRLQIPDQLAAQASGAPIAAPIGGKARPTCTGCARVREIFTSIVGKRRVPPRSPTDT